jgi:uncharacterized Ntn-hydrolase superfamily protein
MELGLDAHTTLAGIRANTEDIEFRQLGVLDHSGRTACYSGLHSLGIFASAHGQNVIALGNLLANAEVPKRMMSAFNENADAELGDRLIAAMQAGLAAGGEAGPMLSAGMIIVDRVPWPIADIRVDLQDEPIKRLSELWKAWRPQMDDYVTRARDSCAISLNPANCSAVFLHLPCSIFRQAASKGGDKLRIRGEAASGKAPDRS